MIAEAPDPPATAMAGWKNSPGHHKGMTNAADPMTGIGVVKASGGVFFLPGCLRPPDSRKPLVLSKGVMFFCEPGIHELGTGRVMIEIFL